MLPNNYNVNPSQANSDIKLEGVQFETNVGANYGEHITNTGAVCNTSASHTYGNVMAVIEKYILDLFRNIDFKTVTASTTLSSRQLSHLPSQLQKKEMPIMVLVPRISFGQDDNRFLGHTVMNDNITNTHSFWGNGSLLELAKDPRKNVYIHGHYNRAVMYIDVIMSFNTYAEQTNVASQLFNMIGIGHNRAIRAPLELFIPNDFCYLISNVTDIPMKSKDGSVYDFMTYMNTIWHHPITYKLKGGSNTDEFFMYYIADIDAVLQDPQTGAGIKDGQIRRAFDVSFTVRCDFNTISYFTLNSPKIKKDIHIANKDDLAIVSMFSDVINLDDFVLPIGWSILSWPIFKLEKGENTISIDSILNQSLRLVIDHHLKFGIPMERFIRIEFRENGQILNNEMYYIDWNQRILNIVNPNYRRTYRLLVTVSHEYVNNLIKDLYNLE